MNREAFEKWYSEQGMANCDWLKVTFPLPEKEFRLLMAAQSRATWQAAKADSAAQVEAIKEQCAVLCETECAQNDGITCAESIREMRIEP